MKTPAGPRLSAALLAGGLLCLFAAESRGQANPLQSTSVGVHDPVIVVEDGTYYLFGTGPGIPIQTSPDRQNWSYAGRAITQIPAWVNDNVPGFAGDVVWAPDVSYFRGLWHLYYSASLFGTQQSVIGLATTPTLEPGAPTYGWTDRGVVINSEPGDDYNAIDPNIYLDDTGTPWMSFGSYWTGIKLTKLHPVTGKQVPGATLQSLASRANGPNPAVEAPFIIKHNNWFYLFVSFDQCCSGTDSTYHIRVGRSRAIDGPYYDRDGVRMLDGGGTLVQASEGRWIGPGHNAVIEEDGLDWLVYHAYDAQAGGAPKLRIDPIAWDASGWPTMDWVTGDANGDGDVDNSDLQNAIANFTGPVGAAGGKGLVQGDASGDGDVDNRDLQLAIANFTGPGGSVVPEPAAIVMLAFGGLLVRRRRPARY